ncbi:MAG: hypothetical protein M3Q47_08810 [Actinomycetota bacterium]|nr:hypothetical protein [Actinomycetota bacterium]
MRARRSPSARTRPAHGRLASRPALPLGRPDPGDPLGVRWDVLIEGEIIVSVGMSELVALDDVP